MEFFCMRILFVISCLSFYCIEGIKSNITVKSGRSPILSYFFSFLFDETEKVEVDFDSVLGSGNGGGSVFKCQVLPKNIPCAVKFDSVESAITRHTKTKAGKPWTLRAVKIEDEISAMEGLHDNPDIVKILGVVTTQKPDESQFAVDKMNFRLPGLVMELLQGVTFKQYFRAENFNNENEARCLLKKALSMLRRIWSSGFYHGDAHMGNFMLIDGPSSETCGVVKVIDLGYTGKFASKEDRLARILIDARTLCVHFQLHTKRLGWSIDIDDFKELKDALTGEDRFLGDSADIAEEDAIDDFCSYFRKISKTDPKNMCTSTLLKMYTAQAENFECLSDEDEEVHVEEGKKNEI